MVFGSVGYVVVDPEEEFVPSAIVEDVTVVEDGAQHAIARADAGTVDDVLRAAGVTLATDDRVFPAREEQVFSGDQITVDRMHAVTIIADKQVHRVQTYRDRVDAVLADASVQVSGDDIVVPSRDAIVSDDMEIVVTRVTIAEESVEKKIPFETKHIEDDTVSFLKKIVRQKGRDGVKTLTYRVAYHDDAEVSRTLTRQDVTRAPVTEEIVQGTKVTVTKTHQGGCSWYSHTDTLAAANPWMPIGSYARVTNKANGRSVIVRINDRGPFVEGRIVDLDRVAFEKIAPLGAGVISVKLEEIH